MNDVILEPQMTSASTHFVALSNWELLFDISDLFSIDSIGEVC